MSYSWYLRSKNKVLLTTTTQVFVKFRHSYLHMSNPLISILTPFKNSESFLEECLDSVLGQSLTNWEMIMVDDHSTDKSRELVMSYAERDERIRCMSNDQHGIIHALRKAFNLSKGKMITRMDSDDIMVPVKLERMSSQLINEGAGHIALGLVKYFPENVVSEGYREYESWINGLTKAGSNFTELYKECVIPSPCWMVFREDLQRCGAFNENFYPEDYDLTFRFFAKGLKCLPCREILHLWRDYLIRTSKTHVHYQQEYFLNLKTRYFLKLHYDSSRPLSLWGAGSKGKQIAEFLLTQKIKFHWISHNPGKIGKKIQNQKVLPIDEFEALTNPQSIVTVADKSAQSDIRSFMRERKMQVMEDFFFFC